MNSGMIGGSTNPGLQSSMFGVASQQPHSGMMPTMSQSGSVSSQPPPMSHSGMMTPQQHPMSQSMQQPSSQFGVMQQQSVSVPQQQNAMSQSAMLPHQHYATSQSGMMPHQQPYSMSQPNMMPHQNNGMSQSGMMSQTSGVPATMGSPSMQSQMYPNSVASQPSRYYPSPQAQLQAGMYNGASSQHSLGRVVSPAIHKPPPIQPIYAGIIVNEPLLIQSGASFLGQPPYWSYQIVTSMEGGGNWLVRRRFRHVVALEDRLREDCPGAILPPRYCLANPFVLVCRRCTHTLAADLKSTPLVRSKKPVPNRVQSSPCNVLRRCRAISRS